MTPDDPLAGASVLVIGGSSGIGLATARAAAERGATVTIASRDEDRLAAAREAIGGRARAIRADAGDESAMRDLFEEVGRLDHIAVLPATSSVGSIVDGDVEVFRRSMEVRFWGALWACRYGAPRMDRGGSITLCSGLVAHRPRAGRAVGTAATAAVEAFARAMALELAPIRVNAVCPGGIDTPLLQREFGDKRDELVASLARRLPVGRIGRPEDVAGAILFLMGNGFVTGITLVVDGGGLLT